MLSQLDYFCEFKMAGKHGGERKGAGRPPTKSVLPGGAVFAQRVLKRVKELKQGDKHPYKNADDYALELLGASDVRVRKETFLALLYWEFGKPLQPVDHNPQNKPVEINVRIHRVGGAKS